MICYKLFRKLKNGDIAPLFINKKQRLKENVWYDAEAHPTLGFKVRPGWHCTLKPEAPHLSTKNRVWKKVKIVDYVLYERPENQGGMWVLANRLKVIGDI